MREDLPLELLQPRPGLEPELVGEPRADALVGGERVGLAARGVERGDQQLPQPLLVRVGGDGGLELADHGVAEPQPRRELRSRAASRAPPRAARGAARPSRRPRAAPRRGSAPAPRRSARRRRGRRRRRSRSAAARASRSTQSASTAPGRRASVYPPSPPAISAGSPSARRSRATFDCSVLRRVAAPAQRSSSEPVGAHDRRPASSARRTSSSAGLAARHRQRPAVARDLDGPEHRDLQHGRESTAASARCQRARQRRPRWSAHAVARSEQLLRRLVVGDDAAIAAIVEASRTSDDPLILVAAALFAADGDALLARAERPSPRRPATASSSPSPRAHRRGERELVDALARDHLVDHPDNVLVAWIADASHSQTPNQGGAMNPRLTAVLLILAAVLANLAFTALGSIFNYPDVLDEPAGEVLADFRAHQGASARGSRCSRSRPRCWRRSRSASGGCSDGPAMRDRRVGRDRGRRRAGHRPDALAAARARLRVRRGERRPGVAAAAATRSRRRATSSAPRSARRSATS